MNSKKLNKFYTDSKTVDKILQEIDLSKFDNIIEPAAGAGSISKEIDGCIAYDILPEDDSIIQMDFLQYEHKLEGSTLVIGNPPFSKGLAMKFIKHAATFADTIAFILPKSYKKNSFYDKIPLNFWLAQQIDIEPYSFTLDDEPYDVPCVFQVYEKRTVSRMKAPKLIPTTFEFVKKEDANLVIRRVGWYAGKASLDIEKSKQTHYFIRANDSLRFVEMVNEIEWKHNNTVAARSISKQELIRKIE